MKNFLYKIKNAKQGTIALILVIMITTITLVSSLVITLISITDLTASYHVTESKSVATNIDACIDDALYRISSSTSVAGSYNLFTSNISCAYEISNIASGYITVTSTASTTSDFGYWQDQVVVLVNVSTTPISIQSYKTSPLGFDSYNTCGDGQCTYGEDCSCSVDCGACVCGNGVTEGDEVCDDGDEVAEGCGNFAIETAGTYCNATCTAEIVISENELCDDGNLVEEGCGNGVKETAATYCNSTCSDEIVIGTSEVCDYTGSECTPGGQVMTGAVGCTKNPYCTSVCGGCTSVCL